MNKFKNYLIYLKIGIIIILLLLTITYYVLNKFKPTTQTYMNNSQFRWKVFIDACITSFLAILSCIFVIVYRRGNIHNHIPSLCMIGFILFLFVICQEACGFNRWLDTSNRNLTPFNNYNQIDNITKPELEKEKGGDPFIKSISILSIIIISIIIFYFIFKMFYVSIKGFFSNQHSIKNNFIYLPFLCFSIEIIIVALINSCSPILSPLIRNEKYTSFNYLFIFLYIVIAIILQLMLQYTGMLNFHL